MSKKIDMIGKRFGRLVVVNEVESHTKPSGQVIAMYNCLCDCGNYKIISGTHLRSGHDQSCGCLKKEQEKHGNTRLAHIWMNMIARCYDEKASSYKNYGAKGITVCESWRNNFNVFKSWALKNGYTDNLTIDRIDNSKGYEAINCRWATKKEQANNTKNNLFITINGVKHTASEWADITGINVKRIYVAHKKGKHIQLITEALGIAEVLEQLRGEE